jgi:hypothetical protein
MYDRYVSAADELPPPPPPFPADVARCSHAAAHRSSS